MKKRLVVALCMVALLLSAASVALAGAPVLKSGDSMHSVLEGYMGKRVTLRLQGGEELTGRVKFVGKELLHLEGLNGREFFDALVDVSRIEALIVRVKE